MDRTKGSAERAHDTSAPDRRIGSACLARALSDMTESKITVAQINQVLIDADRVLRSRLEALGVRVPHIVVAIGPKGNVVIRGNVSVPSLKKIGADIVITLAGEAMRPRSENESLN